jgi:hypothetical protein
MKSPFIAFFLFIFSVEALAIETINFDIFLFGNKIGYVTVTREIKQDGSERYTLETQSKAKLLWINRTNHSTMEVVYKGGKLISSSHKEIDNGKLKRWTNITREENRYEVDSYRGKRTFFEVPTFSVVCIYFKDLSQIKRLFYEAEADFTVVKKSEEPNTWEFKSSDGHRNIYHFENGKIKSIDLHVSIATIKMVRVN